MILRITHDLGQEIIKRLAEYIDFDMNIMNLNGNIVASTDEKRINEVHRGALDVLNTNAALILDDDNIKNYPGTKPVVNLQITHQQKTIGVVGVSGDPKEILSITGLIKVAVEIIVDQIYLHRQAYYKERQWDNWLHQLLHPRGFDQDRLQEEAVYTLDVDTQKNWQILVLSGENAQKHLEFIRQELEQEKIKALFTLLFLDREIVIALPATFRRLNDLVEQLLTITKFEMSIGIGGQAFGIRGMRESYRQAKQALLFADHKHLVSHIEDWHIERLMGAIPLETYESVCGCYEKALYELGDDYIETIDTYLQTNFSIKNTAESLYIHRNTLLYRLDQIREKTGLNPREFHDAFLLKVVRSRQRMTVQMHEFNAKHLE